MKNKGARYDQDFKERVVNLYNSADCTYASLESESAVTIQRGIKELTSVKIKDNESMSTQEMKALQKEMSKLCL